MWSWHIQVQKDQKVLLKWYLTVQEPPVPSGFCSQHSLHGTLRLPFCCFLTLKWCNFRYQDLFSKIKSCDFKMQHCFAEISKWSFQGFSYGKYWMFGYYVYPFIWKENEAPVGSKSPHQMCEQNREERLYSSKKSGRAGLKQGRICLALRGAGREGWWIKKG